MRSVQFTPVMPHQLSSMLRKYFLLLLLSLATIAPTTAAVTSFSSGTLTINFNAANEAVTLSNNGTNISLTSSGTITGAGNTFSTASVTKIIITDTGNLAGQSLLLSGNTGFSLSGGLDCTGVESVAFTNSVTATGSSAIVVVAPQKIRVSGVTLTGGSDGTELTAQGTVPGNSIGIDINNGAVVTASGIGQVSVKGTGGVSTSDNNWGVLVEGTNSKITSSGGPVQVNGTGGGTGVSKFNQGVYLIDGGKILAGATGTVMVQGKGGASDGMTNIGVYVADGNITSSGGDVTITGTGGGSGASAFNYGVYVSNDGEISAVGTGKVTIEGYGGKTTGNANYGVFVVQNSGSLGRITSSDGDMSIKGFGGGKDDSRSNRGVYVWAGGSITTTGTGSVLVEGQGGNTTGDSNQGVRVDGKNPSTAVGSLIGSSGGGNVVVRGTGAGSGASFNNYGMYVVNSAKISAGGSGTVTVEGQGATGANGDDNYGVYVLFAEITSSGGNVSVKGTGGGSGSAKQNYGVHLLTVGKITAGGSGLVKVEGFGGGTTSTGTDNHGVYLNETGTKISSSGGAVTVTGKGGGSGASSKNLGVYVQGAAQIMAGGSGTVNVEGEGGATTAGLNSGILVAEAGSKITSSGGNVSVIGTGGGAGSSSFEYGVYLYNGGQITASSSGTVYVEGKGGNSTGAYNYGIYAEGADARITSSGGNVTVKGTGGEGDSYNYGVYLYNGGEITAGSNGTVNVEGQGGNSTNGTNYNYGIHVDGNNSRITSSGGNVIVKGIAGGIQGYNYGVHLYNGGEITAGSNGTVNVEGQGGNAAAGNNNFNYGIYVGGNNSRITSSGGNVTVKGTGGSGPDHLFNHGVQVRDGGVITAGGNGIVNVEGQGGNTTGGDYNYGIYLYDAQITSSGGNVIVKGTGGTGKKSNIGVNLETDGEITAGGNGTVNVEGQGGNATDESNYGINLRGSITSTNGSITVKGTGSNGAADIMIDGGLISSTSTTAGISINSPTNGIWPNTNTTDVSTTPTQKLTFVTGSKLNIEIFGLTVNTQYRQLNVVGMVDLNGANLTFAGSTYTPVVGNTFTIVNNDAADAIVGTFNGLPEGSDIANFLGSGLSARITYKGGDNNDVVLTVTCPSQTVSSNSPVCTGNQLNLSVSGGTAWSWTGPNSFSNNTQNPSLSSVNTSMGGIYSVTISSVSGCTQEATTQVTIGQTITPELTSNSPLCVGTTLRLSVTSAGAGAVYAWEASVPFSSALQNPTRANATTAMSGVYKLSVSNNGCSATSTISVTVINQPIAQINPSTTQNICQGRSLSLTASGGGPYSWSGPGFSSTSAIISINTNNTNNSGIYTVQVGSTVCIATATISVCIQQATVNVNPNPLSVCIGQTINLSANTSPAASAFSWKGPGNFSSTTQSISTYATTTANLGIYSVSATIGSCVVTSTAEVKSGTVLQAGVVGLPCVGGTIQFTASGMTSYTWSRPTNNFNSTLQNPVIPSSTMNDAGVYFLSARSGSCFVSMLVPVMIAGTGINPSFAVNPSSVAAGATVSLSAASATGTYSWSGPNGFSGTTRTKSISNFQTVNNGVYRLTLTSGTCSGYTEKTISVNSATRLAAAENEPIEMEINAYPNPVTHTLTVEVRLKEASSLQLNLVSSVGKVSGKWQSGEVSTYHRTELDMSTLQDGLYLLQAQTLSEKATKRILKIQQD
ncbi:MAG: T9SS type A sorting domain-containing protein [Spirosomataceae bacterium]